MHCSELHKSIYDEVFCIQKQLLIDVFQNRCSEEFLKFDRKAPLQESLFNNVAGLNACNFVKKRLQHRYFPVKFAKLLRTLPSAPRFCSGSCSIIVSVSNIKCISNEFISQCMINSMMLHSFEDNARISQLMEVPKIRQRMHFCHSWFSTIISVRYVLVFLNYFVFAL